MTDYANSRLAGGKPWTRSAMYRLIESGTIRVTRLGNKGTTVLATKNAIDEALGLIAGADEHRQAA